MVDYSRALEKADNRLLNAFQLVKNGVKIGNLKFSEFKVMLGKERDSNGNYREIEETMLDSLVYGSAYYMMGANKEGDIKVKHIDPLKTYVDVNI